ncbi:MAG: hypothetical protein M3454_12820 [Actinomycetota bacterium]|nr:hypothetical protein [Actinomycetota bacterium]
MRGHDPERIAALYLGGIMSGRVRRRFEQHIIGCEDCWREVEVARRGRTLAESARELGPQELRELVRSTVAVASQKRNLTSRARLGVLACGAAFALVMAVLVLRPSQPQEIEVLLSDYRGSEQLLEQTPAALPSVLGDLELVEVRGGRIEAMSMVVHEYVDPTGHIVTVYRSDSTFPVARGAEHNASGTTWSANLNDVVLFCADRPVPSLVMGDDAREVRLASIELGLK